MDRYFPYNTFSTTQNLPRSLPVSSEWERAKASVSALLTQVKEGNLPRYDGGLEWTRAKDRMKKLSGPADTSSQQEPVRSPGEWTRAKERIKVMSMPSPRVRTNEPSVPSPHGRSDEPSVSPGELQPSKANHISVPSQQFPLQKHIDNLLSNPTLQNCKMFDRRYGAGAAEKAVTHSFENEEYDSIPENFKMSEGAFVSQVWDGTKASLRILRCLRERLFLKYGMGRRMMK